MMDTVLHVLVVWFAVSVPVGLVLGQFLRVRGEAYVIATPAE